MATAGGRQKGRGKRAVPTLDNARNYSEWRKAARAHDEKSGAADWRREERSHRYDYRQIRRRYDELRKLRRDALA